MNDIIAIIEDIHRRIIHPLELIEDRMISLLGDSFFFIILIGIIILIIANVVIIHICSHMNII